MPLNGFSKKRWSRGKHCGCRCHEKKSKEKIFHFRISTLKNDLESESIQIRARERNTISVMPRHFRPTEERDEA